MNDLNKYSTSIKINLDVPMEVSTAGTGYIVSNAKSRLTIKTSEVDWDIDDRVDRRYTTPSGEFVTWFIVTDKVALDDGRWHYLLIEE